MGLRSEDLRPEHGIYGIADEGFSDFVHPLYNHRSSVFMVKAETDTKDLEGLDLLVYDIQDVGLRYYTFIYALAFVGSGC